MEFFPKNSLSHFSNYFSESMPIGEGYAVGISEVGVSNKYTRTSSSGVLHPSIYVLWNVAEHIYEVRDDSVLDSLSTPNQPPYRLYVNGEYSDEHLLKSAFSRLNYHCKNRVRITLERKAFARPEHIDAVNEKGFVNFPPAEHAPYHFTLRSFELPCSILIEEQMHDMLHLDTWFMYRYRFKPFVVGQKKYYKIYLHADQEMLFNVHDANRRGNFMYFKPNRVSIECDEVMQGHFPQQKAIASFSPSVHEDFIVTHFSDIKYFQLRNSWLKQLSLRFVDESGKQISLLSGFSTYVVLKLKKMSEVDQFYVTVSSAANELFPENNVHDFEVLLPNPILLSERWVVSLQTIHSPSNLGSFSKVAYLVEYDSKGFRNYVQIPPGWITPEYMCFWVNQRTKRVQLLYNSKIKKFALKNRTDDEFKVKLSYNLAVYLGHDQSLPPTEEVDMKIEKPVHFFESSYSKFADVPKYGLLYTNFIEPIITSGGRSKLLRVIPVKRDEDFVNNHHEFHHSDFRKLCTSTLQRMKFSIRNHDGEKIHYNSNNSEHLSLTLHFKRTIDA